MKKNVGNVDAILRIILGIFILWLGLVQLNGLEGRISGILIAMFALVPFTIAATRICPVFSIFKISSLPNKNKRH
jgi:hypothetical protein